MVRWDRGNNSSCSLIHMFQEERKKTQNWIAQNRQSRVKPFCLILLMLLLPCNSKIQQLKGSIRNSFFLPNLTRLNSLGCDTRPYLILPCLHLIQSRVTSPRQGCQTQHPTCLIFFFFLTMISLFNGLLMRGKLLQLFSAKPTGLFFPWNFFARLFTVISSQNLCIYMKNIYIHCIYIYINQSSCSSL